MKEGLREEAPDQLIQGIIERYTYNPDKPWKDIIEETLQAGIGGALLGGAAEATTTGLAPAKTRKDQPQPPIPPNTTPVGRPSTPPLSVEQSQKLIHNVMNRPPEQRAHPTTQADFAQAQWVVREQVRKLESQKEPLNETQKKALADAKAALARVEQPDTSPTSTHSSSGNEPNASTTDLPDQNTILDVGGAAGHGKKMDPWDNNPNDQKRTMPEAVEIFRNNFKEFMQLYGKKLGVNINPELINQINFVPNSTIPAENGQRKWAAYRPNALGTGIKGEHTWNDFLKDGKITVEIDPEVLKSDQAIVGIFAHELLELHGIKDMMKTNTNRSLHKEKLQQLINDLHEQAINLQNKFVQFMKDKARKQ